ncbi:alcohol dehydrogenase catalytic domain-containing protein [Dactylosporangium sp. NBC_01737]|uniref:alcohol dehydrogenase catalytic domain-containing protein n=1 Tax=Dactylosporangium sp. NBC_01737 TaxID=2975959 RepID=UPI002E0D684D|nr:alcohol dehydrogenase catalytic domain-containing protein [Dactylosporangium sp. NBC_01737]
MRAAVVNGFDQPLQIEELPQPVPAPDQMLVRITASGLCHTDIHAVRGDWPVKPTPPFIPGHEGVGVVEAVGDGVAGDWLGKRVAIPWLAAACGRCRYCLTGWETLCEHQLNTGYSVNGAYAEYAVAFERGVVEVPDAVSSLDAAPLTCAGVTGLPGGPAIMAFDVLGRDELEDAHTALRAWLSVRGFRSTGSSWEHYRTGCRRDPTAMIADIVVPYRWR